MAWQVVWSEYDAIGNSNFQEADNHDSFQMPE